MTNVVELRPRKTQLLDEMKGTAAAIQKIYESLDGMYATLKVVEDNCAAVEEMFNDTMEAYEADYGDAPEEYAQYYSRGLPNIGEFADKLQEILGDFDDIQVTKVKAEDFEILSSHPAFPEVLGNPIALEKLLEELGIEDHGEKE